MRSEQLGWSASKGWTGPPGAPSADAQLLLVFGGTDQIADAGLLEPLRAHYPHAQLLGCSTAGEIAGTRVRDGTMVATALAFEHTEVRVATVTVADGADSARAGDELAKRLPPLGLAHVLVISNGLRVNGSRLVSGITGALPRDVTVTGGLAGDGARFGKTVVLADGGSGEDLVAAVGFYGDRLRVGYGSLGGWDPFGPQRLVTRAEANVLYELDGQPALALYKQYLGEHAEELPSSGLLFPLSVTFSDGHEPVVRTILAVDESQGSMTFAGDVPVGSMARLMKANFNRLVDGAASAARTCHQSLTGMDANVAILISCVGRKLVLKQRVEEEVEAVQEILGPGTLLTGFYSYGEISPFAPTKPCELHNQTMTITALAEL